MCVLYLCNYVYMSELVSMGLNGCLFQCKSMHFGVCICVCVDVPAKCPLRGSLSNACLVFCVVDTTLHDKHGKTALDWAVERCSTDVAAALTQVAGKRV